MCYVTWILSVAFSLFAARYRSYWSVSPVMLVSMILVILTRKESPLPQRRGALGRDPGGDLVPSGHRLGPTEAGAETLLLSGGEGAPPDSPRSGHWVSGKER